jgi:hypothetical protein
MLLVNRKLPITLQIVPAGQEFIHMNTLWCYLFYKLVGDYGATRKCLSTFAIDTQIGQTIATLSDKTFSCIPSTDNKRSPYITTMTVAYIFALAIDSITIYRTDSPHCCALQHETSVLEALDGMPAYEFRAELLASLTDFFEKILKKVGAGGRAAKKPLPRKFTPKIAPVPAPEDASDGASAEEQPSEPTPAHPLPPRGGSRGSPREPGAADASRGQRDQRPNKKPKGRLVVVLIESCLCLH